MPHQLDAGYDDARQDERGAQRVELERGVLGALLSATESFDVVADVSRQIGGGDFYRPAHALIFDAAVRLHGNGQPTTPLTVSAELKTDLARAGGPAYLHGLVADALPAPSAAYYAEQMRGHALLERFREAAVRGVLSSDKADPARPEEAIAAHAAEVEQLLTDRAGDDQDFGRIGDTLPAHLELLERDAVPPAAITGFMDLDALMKIDAGQMILAAGRPGMGKSAFALCVAAANAASGRPSLFCSLEMGSTEVHNRVLAARARVGFHRLTRGNAAMTDDDWDSISRQINHFEQLPLWLDFQARTTPGRVRSRARTLMRETGVPPLVVVDYLQLMGADRTERRHESRYAEVSEISRELKLLARETGCVVLALAQLNRGPEQRTDKRPLASDLRDSGQLEQDADAIILLHREDAYEKESPRAGETDLLLVKHRNGQTAEITVAHQFHYSRFVDMAKD